MVTVIKDKEELTTSAQNGSVGTTNENRKNFDFIRDYREVDLHQYPSSKPFPNDIIEQLNNTQGTPSIKGLFFVQVDTTESGTPKQNTRHSNEPMQHPSCLLLTVTDGKFSVKCLAEKNIPNLCSHMKPGCKLLINGMTHIHDGVLHLTQENTRFEFGSNHYPQPRSVYQGRSSGLYRSSTYETRQTGGNHRNTRNDHESGGVHFIRPPPPKTTLKDFMRQLEIGEDAKVTSDTESDKLKDRPDLKRRQNEPFYKSHKTDYYRTHTSKTYSNLEPNQFEIDVSNASHDINGQQIDHSENETFDVDEDSSHLMHRERRNPLPPRLQRIQEERSRKNTLRGSEDSTMFHPLDMSNNYEVKIATNSMAPTSYIYFPHGNEKTFVPNGSPTANLQYNVGFSTYSTYPNAISGISNPIQPTVSYYGDAAQAPMQYGITNPSSITYPTQSGAITSFPVDHYGVYYGQPYGTYVYMAAPPIGQSHSFQMMYGPEMTNQPTDENETTVTNESHIDETNDSENRSQSSSMDNKHTISSSCSSLNDTNLLSKNPTYQQLNEVPQELPTNIRPRWKIGDLCLARWHEDREFYIATINQIHPPYCTVLFRDYGNQDRVHFKDLKTLSQDHKHYSPAAPISIIESDINPMTDGTYFPPCSEYYPSTVESYVMMPEAPPFPFNSTGTKYVYQPSYSTTLPRTNRVPTNSQSKTRRTENGDMSSNSETTMNSNSSPSKDSINTSTTDSTMNSSEDAHPIMVSHGENQHTINAVELDSSVAHPQTSEQHSAQNTNSQEDTIHSTTIEIK